MSAVKSFQLAIDMATRQRDQANQVLSHAENGYLFAKNQMVQLETYAAETESRWVAAAQISTSPELLRHHYQFMGRLHHAIGLQKDALENESRKVEFSKKRVLDAEFRLMGLKQVLKKKQGDLAALQTRREQKQMDEFAAMRRSPTMGDIPAENDHGY
jgi:flagellar FliJ protein